MNELLDFLRKHMLKRTVSWLMIVFVIGGILLLCGLRGIANSQESKDVSELSRLEKAWNDAHIKGDEAALDRLWEDEVVITVPNMDPMGKADAIGIWRTGRMKIKSYETSDIRIQVYANAAVVTGRLLRSRELNGKSVDDDWRFTKVYIRRNQLWRVVAWHASPSKRG